MTELILPGCRTTPLGSYLAARGLLRAVTRLLDCEVTGRWERQRFVLDSHCGALDELVDELLTRFEPEAIVSPWNASSGFAGNGKNVTAERALQTIRQSEDHRLVRLKEAVHAGDCVVALGRERGWGGKGDDLWDKAHKRTRPAPRLRPQPHRHSEPAAAVRFSVLQPGLPPQTDSLIYTDLLRQGALSKLGRLPEERTRTQLVGRTADDAAMTGHGHAHYLPLTTDRRLTGLVVWVPNGLLDDELKALTIVERLYSKINADWRLTVRVAGIGMPGQVAPELTAPQPAAIWRSLTPFTPTRYPKRNAGWLDYLRTEVATELTNRSLPPPRDVTLLDEPWQPWRRYRPSARMRRDTRQGQATRPSAFLRIELTEPTHGPLALGHLSHFGLGLFMPER